MFPLTTQEQHLLERLNRHPHFKSPVESLVPVDAAGQSGFHCCEAGFGGGTDLHAVGDGALWINEPVEKPFGAQGHYRLDFYPVGEYFGHAAVAGCGEEGKNAWLEQQKNFLKEGNIPSVIEALKPPS